MREEHTQFVDGDNVNIHCLVNSVIIVIVGDHLEWCSGKQTQLWHDTI